MPRRERAALDCDVPLRPDRQRVSREVALSLDTRLDYMRWKPEDAMRIASLTVSAVLAVAAIVPAAAEEQADFVKKPKVLSGKMSTVTTFGLVIGEWVPLVRLPIRS